MSGRPPLQKAASYRMPAAVRVQTSDGRRASDSLAHTLPAPGSMTSPRVWEMLLGGMSSEKIEVPKPPQKPQPRAAQRPALVRRQSHIERQADAEVLAQLQKRQEDMVKSIKEDEDDIEDDVSLGSAKDHITHMLKDAELRFHLNNLSNLRRKYDTLKHRAQSKMARLEGLKDQLAELLAEQDQNEECEKRLTSPVIQELQTECKQAQADVDEEVNRRYQLEFMRRRTIADHSRYDAEVQNAKRDLEVALSDLNNHQLLARMEKNELKVAQKKLKEFKVYMVAEKKRHEQKLAQRKAGAQEHTQILELREEMEVKRKQIWDSEKDKGAPVLVNRKKAVSNAFKALRLKQAIKKEETRVGHYRAQYLAIQRAIGGATVEEIISRIKSQPQTTHDLDDMLEMVRSEKKDLEKESGGLDVQMSDIRFSGIGHVSKERKQLQEFDTKLRNLRARVRVQEDALKRMVDLTTAIKSGVWSMHKSLGKIKMPQAGVPVADGATVTGTPITAITNDNLNDSLAQVEWKVLRLLDTIALENYDNFNVLDMLPPPQNVMVPTEDEWERILAIEAEREENPEVVAESAAGSKPGAEPPKMDRDTMKAFAGDIVYVRDALTAKYREDALEALDYERTGRSTLPKRTAEEIEQKVEARIKKMLDDKLIKIEDVNVVRADREVTAAKPSRSSRRRRYTVASPHSHGAPKPQELLRRESFVRRILKQDAKAKRKQSTESTKQDSRPPSRSGKSMRRSASRVHTSSTQRLKRSHTLAS